MGSAALAGGFSGDRDCPLTVGTDSLLFVGGIEQKLFSGLLGERESGGEPIEAGDGEEGPEERKKAEGEGGHGGEHEGCLYGRCEESIKN